MLGQLAGQLLAAPLEGLRAALAFERRSRAKFRAALSATTLAPTNTKTALTAAWIWYALLRTWVTVVRFLTVMMVWCAW